MWLYLTSNLKIEFDGERCGWDGVAREPGVLHHKLDIFSVEMGGCFRGLIWIAAGRSKGLEVAIQRKSEFYCGLTVGNLTIRRVWM